MERFDIPADDIRVIPNFVDLEQYRPDIEPCHRSKLAGDHEMILMHISNFRPVKRVDDAVRVLARVNRSVPSRLVLIGDGPERGRAQETAEEHDVTDRVVFLGKQESVAELLACADLFLLPSENEAFGLVALEAMACGVPVVGSRVGGLPEVVPPEAGHLAPVGAIDEMADFAVALLSDPDRLRQTRAAAREVATTFDADIVVPRYEAHYREVLAS